jgi:hypothetical protein
VTVQRFSNPLDGPFGNRPPREIEEKPDMTKLTTSRTIIASLAAVPLMLSTAAGALAAPNAEATCVGLASAFFASNQIRDDVAHAIRDRFDIPPGAEVSRFAQVQLGDLEACLINGQG